MTDERRENQSGIMNTETEKKEPGIHAVLVDNYSFMTIGKRKIVKSSFPTQLDFDYASKREILSLGQAALLANGCVFAYKDKKQIKAVFIIDKKERSFDCTAAYFASSVSEKDAESMKKDIRRQVALLCFYAGFRSGTYLGETVPTIVKEKRDSALFLAMLIGLCFGISFYPATHSFPMVIFLGLSQVTLWYAILHNRLTVQEPVQQDNSFGRPAICEE